MLYLFLSISCSVLLYIVLKLFTYYKINNAQGIVANYYTCVAVGTLFFSAEVMELFTQPLPVWFKFAVVLGFLFITGFYIIALSAQKSGITVTTLAGKLCLICPVIYALFFYDTEKITTLKIAGILLSLVAVVLTVYKKNVQSIDNEPQNPANNSMLLPIIVFIMSGILETILNHVQHYYLLPPPNNNANFSVAIFGIAAILGTFLVCYLRVIKRQKIELKNIIAGIVLGIPNFFSIYFFVKALQGQQSTAIYPTNHIGIIFVSTIIALFFFKEKLTPLNYAGLLIAIIAIFLVNF